MDKTKIKDTINNIFEIMINATKSRSKNTTAPYDEGSAEYTNIELMVSKPMGIVASHITNKLTSTTKDIQKDLDNYSSKINKKISSVFAKSKDEMDCEMAHNGKPNEYEKIEATTEEVGKSFGEKLKNGCNEVVDIINNADNESVEITKHHQI